MRIMKLVSLGLVALGVAAAPAMAQQNATVDGYSSMPISVPPSSAVKGAAANHGPSAATLPNAPAHAAVPTPAVTSPSGSLPFTGLDVGIVAALAVALAGLGFGLRRITRTSAG